MILTQVLASIFTDHMVIQRQTPMPVWEGRQVTITLGGQHKSIFVPNGGYWQIQFDPIDTNESLTAGDGVTTITRRNIAAGKVWVCAGQ